jgi:phosphate-selective porin OprO/OprP
MDQTKLIGTPTIAASGATLYGFEAAATFQNFYVGGEYYHWQVEGDGPTNVCAINTSTCERGLTPEFSAWYVEGSWVITGETKSYDAGHASFGSPRPDHNFDPVHGTGWGAFELLARYSTIDLNWNEGTTLQSDTTVAGLGGVRGGEQTITTIGLNWYLNPNLRMMFDYEMVSVDKLGNPVAQPLGSPPPCGTAACQAGQDLNIFATRASFAF